MAKLGISHLSLLPESWKEMVILVRVSLCKSQTSSDLLPLPPQLPHQALSIFGVFVCVRERDSLGYSSWPGTHYVDQVGMDLRDSHASAYQILGLKGTPHHTQLYLFLARDISS